MFRERIDETMQAHHREEMAAFAREEVEDDEAAFIPCSRRALLVDWRKSGKPKVRAHAENVIERYAP